MEGPSGTTVTLNGKKYLYFAGTSYFNLHRHPGLIKSAAAALEQYGLGSATSRTLSGTTPAILELERLAASFFGTEDAVYLPSGYLSNLAGFDGLMQYHPFHRIYVDEYAHYSLCDAARATGKPVCEFGHLNADDLQQLLEETLKPGDRPLVASDGLFPVSGKMPPAARYLEIVGRYGGVLWLDDAHGSGITGASGRGTAEELGLENRNLFTGTTLSKAFGAYGGVVSGNASFIAKVRRSGAYQGSNAPLSAAVAAGIKGMELVRSNPGLRKALREKAFTLKQGLAAIGLPVTPDDIPIASFTWGDAKGMIGLRQKLLEEGIYIQYTSYRGSGPEGALRMVVCSDHSRQEIDRLIEVLGHAL